MRKYKRERTNVDAQMQRNKFGLTQSDATLRTHKCERRNTDAPIRMLKCGRTNTDEQPRKHKCGRTNTDEQPRKHKCGRKNADKLSIKDFERWKMWMFLMAETGIKCRIVPKVFSTTHWFIALKYVYLFLNLNDANFMKIQI